MAEEQKTAATKERLDNLETSMQKLIGVVDELAGKITGLDRMIRTGSSGNEIPSKEALANHVKPFSNFGPIPRDGKGNILDENLKRRIESGEVVLRDTSDGAMILDNVQLSK